MGRERLAPAIVVGLLAIGCIGGCIAGCVDAQVDAERGPKASKPAQDPSAQQPAPPPELTPAEAAKVPPFPPADVKVKPTGTAATVTWQPSALENVIAYRVYRRTSPNKFVKIGESRAARFVDKAPRHGAVYSVTAVNAYGAESPLAEPSPQFRARQQ